jgi:hypothetical protein
MKETKSAITESSRALLRLGSVKEEEEDDDEEERPSAASVRPEQRRAKGGSAKWEGDDRKSGKCITRWAEKRGSRVVYKSACTRRE